MKYIRYTLVAFLSFILSSCGEDRTGEFYALIEDRMWIEETMREHYLWYDQIPAIEKEADYFKEASTFFKNLLYKQALNGKGDSYSYMEEIPTTEEETPSRAMYLSRTSTYGMEFELMRDPLGGTTHTLARILYVLPGSPAEAAGIQRGDWLTTIGQKYITTDNYKALMYGETVSFARDRIIVTEEGKYAWQAVDTVTVSPSIHMEINPFLVNKVIESNGQKIAYLVYNEFATGPNNEGSETTYHEQMKQIFAGFKAQNPDAFILDLRYNTGGFLSCAQVLGSLLAPSDALGKSFVKLQYNDKSDPQLVNYLFDTQYGDANLNLKKIYILTSQHTASASEAIINGLKPYMGAENVILIGEKTEGKNVAISSYKDERFNYVLWPVVAYIFNANDEGDYTNGFEPQYKLIESNVISPWHPLGDENEFLLKNTLSLITTGTMPDIETKEENEVQTLMSSVSARAMEGIRIK